MSTITRTSLNILAVLALTLIVAAPARADLFSFTTWTGQSQADFLFLDVTQSGDSAVFTFSNGVADSSTITNLYWDWGSLASTFTTPSNFVESAGVQYLDNRGDYRVANLTLPGYNTSFDAEFAIAPQAAGGLINNGIASGETLSVTWGLNGLDFSALLAALSTSDVRVGIHVQGLPDGSSFSATTTATPIPGAVWLLGAGLFGLVGIRRARVLA